MRRVPVSLGNLVVAAVWAVLTTLPGVGLVMSIVLAPFWTVLFINSAFFGAGVEAFTGRVSRYWLALPIAWFGGYGLFVANDYRQLNALRDEIAVSNAKTKIPFDPADTSLTFTDNNIAPSLLANYRIPVVYVTSDIESGEAPHSLRLISTKVCAEINDAEIGSKAGIQASSLHDVSLAVRGNPQARSLGCTLSVPEEPLLPKMRVATRLNETKFGTLPITLSITKVSLPERKSFVLKGGTASPLKWIPMPVLGCFVWIQKECMVRFWRSSSVPLIAHDYGRTGAAPLALALGLEPESPSRRSVMADREATAMVNTAINGRLDRELTSLDAFIRNPLQRTKLQWFSALNGRVGDLLPRLDAMARGVARLRQIEGYQENADVVIELIQTLPRDQVKAYDTMLYGS